MPLYFVVLFDTFALVGRVPPGPDAIGWVESRVAEFPQWDGEYQRGWSHGSREVLGKQFGWFADDHFDECDRMPALQQQVWYEGGDGE